MAASGHPKARRIAGKVVRYALLSLLAFIVIFPLYITVVNSLLRPDQIAARPPTKLSSPGHSANVVTPAFRAARR